MTDLAVSAFTTTFIVGDAPGLDWGNDIGDVVNQITAILNEGLPDADAEASAAVGTAAITRLANKGDGTPATEIAGIFATKVELGWVFADKVTAFLDATANPRAALVGTIENHVTNSASVPNDAVGVLGHANAKVQNSVAFGGTFIARSENITGAKLVGVEIDMVPGDTVDPGSVALPINSFGDAIPAAVQTGGAWTNGLVMGGTFTGGMFVAGGSSTGAYAIHTGNGTFSTAAAVLGNLADAPALILEQLDSSSPTANIFEVKTHTPITVFAIDADGDATFTSPASDDQSVRINVTTAGANGNLVYQDAGTNKWIVRKNSANNIDWLNAAISSQESMQLSIAALGANETPLFLREDSAGVETLRRVQWFDPGANGDNFVGGEKVLVLA